MRGGVRHRGVALVMGHQGPPVKIRRIGPDPLRMPSRQTSPRKKRASSRMLEHHEQRALIKWAVMNERSIPALANLYAVPNGGKRSAITASLMKAEGVKPGVPDLVLAWPARSRESPLVILRAGLYIEMKAPGRKPTPDQVVWRNRLIDAGYAYWLCFDWRQAANAIIDYLGHEFDRYRVA